MISSVDHPASALTPKISGISNLLSRGVKWPTAKVQGELVSVERMLHMQEWMFSVTFIEIS